jgi:hypothetical protein
MSATNNNSSSSEQQQRVEAAVRATAVAAAAGLEVTREITVHHYKFAAALPGVAGEAIKGYADDWNRAALATSVAANAAVAALLIEEQRKKPAVASIIIDDKPSVVVVVPKKDRVKAANEDYFNYMHGDQESKDYKPFIDALDRIVAYPRFPDYKPSKIELMVKDVRDKIEAEYKSGWEEYERVLIIKKDNIRAAHAAAREDNNDEAAAAKKKARH